MSDITEAIRELASPWLDAKAAAARLHTTERNFREHVAVQPGFPRPKKRTGLRLLWSAKEIDQWLESA